MSNNPFADAVKPTARQGVTEQVEHPPFFRDAAKAEELRKKARNMSRQQLFNNGIIGVQDLDDEELRAGRCRDEFGRIPKVNKTMEMIPRDLYDAMVQEHQLRQQDKFRQHMDAAIDTIVGIMLSPESEPKDRLDAAKYIKEQVMGKTPDRVQVQVAKAPWEQIAMDVARTTRAQHELKKRALENGVIDAEVVDDVVPQGVSEVHADGRGSPRPERGETPMRAEPERPSEQPTFGVTYPTGDPRIKPATPAPGHDNPVSNNSTAPPPNSDIIRWEQCDAVELATRRANARKRIEDAKKRRRARRATGADMLSRHKITTHEVLDSPEGDTGKLRHTLE